MRRFLLAVYVIRPVGFVLFIAPNNSIRPSGGERSHAIRNIDFSLAINAFPPRESHSLLNFPFRPLDIFAANLPLVALRL